ncbi:MAG: hypothetical protein OHK0011_17860 [Turneriella sp.]
MPRSQAERRHETQQKLLDATVRCIVNHGFSRLTTIEIARTAGVSQGALFRYYPTKTAAVVAATDHLFAKVMADFDELMGRQGADLTQLIDNLEAWFASGDFLAISRLFAESSADAELRDAIRPIVEQHQQNTDELIRRLFPAAEQSVQRTAAHAVIYLLQGIATERHLLRDGAIKRDIMQLVRNLAGLIEASSQQKQ